MNCENRRVRTTKQLEGRPPSWRPRGAVRKSCGRNSTGQFLAWCVVAVCVFMQVQTGSITVVNKSQQDNRCITSALTGCLFLLLVSAQGHYVYTGCLP